VDPFDLADRQMDLDRVATHRAPELLGRKRKKLVASPLGFFRGSARLFYEVLAARPKLMVDESASGAVVGDMHLENVGAYLTDDDVVAFGLNDFDDAGTAPLWIDVLRLSTSVILAARAFPASATEALELVEILLRAYDEAATTDAPVAALPKPIAAMCEKAERRTRRELLDARAPVVDGRRCFQRGERYFDLDEEERSALPALMDAYRDALGERAPAHAAEWKITDAAHRVAGNGSLGRRRIAVLVEDDRGTERMFELKEALPPSYEGLFSDAGSDPAARLVRAANALTPTPPRQLAALRPFPFASFQARKLCPEEDKLTLEKLSVGPKLELVVAAIGRVLGRAHRRGAAGPIPARSREQRDALVDRAVRLAGIFVSVYFAYARRWGR
jgi:uncharacterized protein (DUF2252 family)